jgi:hypothetical protein
LIEQVPGREMRAKGRVFPVFEAFRALPLLHSEMPVETATPVFRCRQ